MSTVAEHPFHEHEERAFLAEIIKASSLSPSVLLKLIREAGIEPKWTDIPLPYGRSVSACQKAYDALLSRLTPGSLTLSHPVADPEPKAKNNKRPLSIAEPSAVTERTIQPRPSAFAPVNGQEQPASGRSEERPRKKRGRPSKAEHELRVAEAAARGEVYPPPKKAKTPRQSTEGLGGVEGAAAPTAIMFASENADIPVEGPPSLASKKKKRVNRALDDARKLSIDEATSAAEQIQEEAGRAAEGVIAETQMPVFNARENRLLAEMQAAAAIGPDQDIQMRESETVEGGGTSLQGSEDTAHQT